jgi:hypothetical protein
MGVLEDAIREHLELKRAHGASDQEVEREEAEVLGPARGPAPEEAAEGEDLTPEGVHDEPFDEAPELAPDDELQPEPAPLESEVDDTPTALDISEPEPEPPAPADFTGDFDAPEDFVEDADPMAEPAPPEPEPAPREPEPEAITFDEDEPGVAPPMPEPADDASEDVLDDTPDFLQDTPEHDRLWFEQKPPRDFDFD